MGEGALRHLNTSSSPNLTPITHPFTTTKQLHGAHERPSPLGNGQARCHLPTVHRECGSHPAKTSHRPRFFPAQTRPFQKQLFPHLHESPEERTGCLGQKGPQPGAAPSWISAQGQDQNQVWLSAMGEVLGSIPSPSKEQSKMTLSLQTRGLVGINPEGPTQTRGARPSPTTPVSGISLKSLKKSCLLGKNRKWGHTSKRDRGLEKRVLPHKLPTQDQTPAPHRVP